ncbi:sugar phosphate isomerase/epimerase [Rhizobium sp. P38BS-XIX]|uniref:sugar phosphate isomerase/epimerase family protein n=1 Tax=Rhizobium sp. P38BS-XIX TaxID=2726740 RepID=UPI001456B462|nr:sugar phosphate isomerase/epimerase [Rhizobium sp. P38BS-XIX]NLS01067.1 sugar phosphate isomerase/epimerase [Rhizobium sp. P38BS-XIX]
MNYKIAYQLYSSRNFPPLATQLPILKSMGYDAIEPWLPAYEADPALFRRQLDDAGLACFGFHMPLTGLVNEPARYLDIAETLGATYLIPPFVPKEERRETSDFWKGIGNKLAVGADKAAERDLKVAWHNHDFEYFALPDGSRPIEHILGQSEAVLFEIDCGWITRAGADPALELQQYADRIACIQVKDTAPLGTVEDDGWTATGDGIIDWAALAPLFRKTTADHIVTEHDNPSDWQRFALRSIDYLSNLGL